MAEDLLFEVLCGIVSFLSVQRNVEFVINWDDGGLCSLRRRNGD